jgi:hypothetical protein
MEDQISVQYTYICITDVLLNLFLFCCCFLVLFFAAPADTSAPNSPIQSMLGGGVAVSDYTTNQGSGQYVPQTLTAPSFD